MYLITYCVITGQVTAEAFLTFFTTWLVYVFINELVKRAPTHRVMQSAKTKDMLVQLKSWLDQQGNLYSVKDYYLGLSSWDEVAKEMLGFTNVDSPTVSIIV